MNSSSRRLMPRGSWSRMCWICIMGVVLSRRCSPMKMSKKIPIAGVPTPSVGKNSGKSRVNGCGTCASPWDRRCREVRLREIEWAPPKEAPAVFVAEEPPPEEYGPWQWAAAFGRATGRFGAEDFVLQEDGKLRCPAGASLWLSEVRQENAFTQRAVYLAYQTDCQPCSLREQCLASGAKGDRARRVSAVRRLLPPPAPVPVERKPVLLGPIRWVDVAGRALRRTWMTHWRRQYVEILPLVGHAAEPFPSPSPTTCGALASPLELARSARVQCLVGTTPTAHHCCWRSRFSR